MFIVFVVTLLQAPQVPTAPQPALTELEGTWVVDIIDNIKVMPEAPVTIMFRGARVTGTASCNSFQGGVAVEKQTLKFDSIIATLKACDGPRMSQERDFLMLLRNVTRYELGRDGVLALMTAEGKRLSARKK